MSQVPNQQAGSPAPTIPSPERTSCDCCGAELLHQDRAPRQVLARESLQGSRYVLEATADQAICLRLDVEDLRLCWECGLRLLLDPLLRHFRAESGESRVESQKGIAESERPGNSPALDSPPSALDSLGIDGRGGLNAAVITDAKSERVVVHFGRKPLTWIGMKPSEARAFAEMLLAAAIELETAPLVADILAEEATKDEGQRTKDET